MSVASRPHRAARLLTLVRAAVTTALLLSAPWLASATDAPGATAAKGAPGTKRALLIGINNYKAVPHLMGSINDVEAMRQILITRWGFAPENIRTLTDEQATRAAMLEALRRIVRESGPHDTVVIHYSGHGSQVQDLNGDEDDGLDETLVPWDGRTPGVPDIVDDQLDEIFSKFRTPSVLVVLDSCHSGTATRGLEFRARGIPQDMRIDLYQDTSVRTRAIVPVMQSKLLVMSAVAADQEALDGPIDAEYHGIFTYALSRSLASAPPGASPRAVFDRVGQEMKRLQTLFGRGSLPEPQLEGPPAGIDQPLLAGTGAGPGADTGTAPETASSPRLAWLSVQPGSAGRVTLTQGVLLGAAKGSIWSIYPPGDNAFAPGRALAVATVTGSSGLDALATLEPASAHIDSASRAVALMPAAESERVAVRLMSIPDALRTQIETVLLRTIHNVEIVGAGKPARFLIDWHDNAVRLLSADGAQVLGTFDTHTDQWADAVAHVISRSTGASELLALDNPASQIQLHAEIVGAGGAGQTTAAAGRGIGNAGRAAATAGLGSARIGARDIVVVADTRPAQLHIRHADEARSAQNSLQLAVTVNTDAYVTIVDVDSDGNANLLFPNDYQHSDFWPDGRVRRNQTLTIPDGLAPGNRAGFFWDYGPPAGTDTIRIFASTDAATARLIRGRIRTLQPARGGTRGLSSEVSVPEGLSGLRQALTKLTTRGIVLTQDTQAPGAPAPSPEPAAAQPDWVATSLTVSIAEK